MQLILREMYVFFRRCERGRLALGGEVRAAEQSGHVAVQHVPQHLREERVAELLGHLELLT